MPDKTSFADWVRRISTSSGSGLALAVLGTILSRRGSTIFGNIDKLRGNHVSHSISHSRRMTYDQAFHVRLHRGARYSCLVAAGEARRYPVMVRGSRACTL